ncbi:MAG UNVERIFIED_CONTAM: hypothetical protein LVR18_46705 [Planctomycetaceae bacterium]
MTASAGSSSYDLQLLAGAVTTGAATLQNTGTVTLGDGPDAGNNLDVFTFGTGLTRSGGPTAIAGDVRTTNSAAVDQQYADGIGNQPAAVRQRGTDTDRRRAQ